MDRRFGVASPGTNMSATALCQRRGHGDVCKKTNPCNLSWFISDSVCRLLRDPNDVTEVVFPTKELLRACVRASSGRRGRQSGFTAWPTWLAFWRRVKAVLQEYCF